MHLVSYYRFQIGFFIFFTLRNKSLANELQMKKDRKIFYSIVTIPVHDSRLFFFRHMFCCCCCLVRCPPSTSSNVDTLFFFSYFQHKIDKMLDTIIVLLFKSLIHKILANVWCLMLLSENNMTSFAFEYSFIRFVTVTFYVILFFLVSCVFHCAVCCLLSSTPYKCSKCIWCLLPIDSVAFCWSFPFQTNVIYFFFLHFIWIL